MQDITELLHNTMKDNQCNALCAFLILTSGEEYVHLYKSKSSEQPSRGLCNKGNLNTNQ